MTIRSLAACFVIAFMLQSVEAQPFAVPVGNLPGNATGVSPGLGVAFGDVEFADFNADTHLDFIVTGRISEVAGGFLPVFAALYRNQRVDFNGLPPPPPRFDFIRSSLIDPVWLSSHAFEDIDGDGDLDMALIGATTIEEPYSPIAKILQLDNDRREYNEIFLLPGLYSGSLDWGDYDNDGDADLLATGMLESGIPVTLLVSNNDLLFQVESTSFEGVAYGEARFVDIDNDYDLDVALAGTNASGEFVADIYRNEGSGVYSLTANDLVGVSFASMDWGDYDADGDMDLALSGGKPGAISIAGTTTIYNNDGTGLLTPIPESLTNVYYGDSDWIDFDRDGDLDLVAIGSVTPFTSPRTLVQTNSGGSFSERTIQTSGLGAAPVEGLRYAAGAWGDFDEDNDLDFLVSGSTGSDSLFTALYGNAAGPNFRPNPPFSLSSSVSGSSVTLTWDAGSDFETPSAGLTYNIYVGTTPGGTDVVAPNSLPDGKRLVIRPGNAGSNTGWRIDNLPIGTYYWNVQAVDTDMRGSSFSVEQQFVIN
ncbi:MAG: VCBS repeat-containing protein [Rhodothermales bacterium]|nr:VCBS repeat-containing protein [Rhodothermales bacterium]